MIQCFQVPEWRFGSCADEASHKFDLKTISLLGGGFLLPSTIVVYGPLVFETVLHSVFVLSAKIFIMIIIIIITIIIINIIIIVLIIMHA